jgi:hypothetical protein
MIISTITGKITVLRAHDVGSSVENGNGRVDDAGRSPAVHRKVTITAPTHRLSSTALTAPDASVHGDCATFSPVSTDAKTMDETLSTSMGNDKSDHQVDCGDNPLVERSDA